MTRCVQKPAWLAFIYCQAPIYHIKTDAHVSLLILLQPMLRLMLMLELTNYKKSFKKIENKETHHLAELYPAFT